MAKYEETESIEFPFSITPALSLDSYAGAVKIAPGESDRIIINITRKARATSDEDAREAVKKVKVTANQVENTLDVRVRYGENEFPFIEGLQGAYADLEILVPSTTSLNLLLRTGQLTLNNIGGTIKAEVNAGQVFLLGAYTSAALTLNTGSLKLDEVYIEQASEFNVNAGEIDGSISLDPRASLKVSVNTGSIHLLMPASTATRLDASVSVGKLSIEGWDVKVDRHLFGMQSRAIGMLGAPQSDSILTLHTDVGQLVVRKV
jgi:hypothetical protein